MTINAPSAATDPIDIDDGDAAVPVKEPRLWQDDGWTAKVVKNEDDEGWAVEMYKDGEREPALIGPWTMGRNKKDPKPLDVNAFHTLIKTASEVITRHEQSQHAKLNKSVTVDVGDARWKVALQIVPDDDDAHALLSATDSLGEYVAKVRVRADFRLNVASAVAWVESEFRRPG
jgi:hypothetical protein